MAPRILKRTLVASAITAFVALTLIACGGDDNESDPTTTPQPATPTTAPTEKPPTPLPASTPTKPPAETNDIPGLAGVLLSLNKQLATGSVDALIARFKVVDYTCKASDLTPGLGQPDCKTEGEVIHGFQTSGWRSEGGLKRVESVIDNLKGYQAGFDMSKKDTYGPGTFRVFAYDPSKMTAVLTVTSKCLPQYQCPSGFQRLVFVPTFEHVDGSWKISSLMYAFVSGEEFLDPISAEVKLRMPQYTKF